MSGTMRGNDIQGFTLIELLVAMVIAAIVMTSVYSVYYSQQKSYITQEEVAAMHQNLRAAISIMEREIRMAGCDPTGSAADAGMVDMLADRIRFREDVRGKDPGDPPDGDTADADEDISFFLTDADGDGQADDLLRDTQGAEAAIEKVIAENISSLTFAYLDSDGDPTGIAEDVRFVHIILTATNKDGSKTETLQTRIYARNLGI
jgi:type IV pilus assembly protein PilW